MKYKRDEEGIPIGPYAFMDDSTLGYDTGVTFSTHRGFSDKQRRYILEWNRKQNGGVVVSDAWGDPDENETFRYLTGIAGAVDSPEVDHIDPNAGGGCNYYANARVISKSLNASKGRKR